MDRTIYAIQIRHLRHAVEHLQLLDLDELRIDAASFGTEADLAVIDAVRAFLIDLPRGQPP